MNDFPHDYSIERKELRLRLKVRQFDAAVLPEFKQALDAAWKPDTLRVVLELSAVELIDSSGVGALLSVQKRLPAKGEAVILRGARPAIVSVLELLRLHRVFRLE